MNWNLVVLGLIGTILLIVGWNYRKRDQIQNWGWRIGLLLMVGLALCFAAVFRDGYIHSVMASTDPQIAPGLFPVSGLVSNTAMAMGFGLLALGGFSLFQRDARKKKWIFGLIFMVIAAKTIFIEISRGML